MFRSAVALAVALSLPLGWAADTPVPSATSRSDYQSTRAAVDKAGAASVAPVANRQARYQDAPSAAADGVSGGREHRDPALLTETTASKTAAKEAPRPAEVSLRQSGSHSFRLWDAGRALRHDADADGYHRRFEIRFDADVSIGDALVYAKLYLRRVGDSGPWEHYYTTNDFWIYGSSDTDDYYVETTLNDGYPTADYDVLVDLYESGYSGIVATIGPFDDSSLRDLPLEDSGLDMPLPNAGYHLNGVSTTLQTDADRDGYYSRFSVRFDPDREVGIGMAYAVLRVRPDGGEWQTEHTTATFQVDESGTLDEQTITAEWSSGYPTARYDLQIDLYDAATQLLVASVSSERAALSRVPLEDAVRDTVPNSGGGNGGGGDSDSDGSGGGGSMSIVLLGVAAGLLYARWRLNRDRLLQRARIKSRLH